MPKRRPRRDRTFLLPIVGGLFLAAGMAVAALYPLEPPLFPVRGTVLHRGAPAAGAVIVFHPVGGDPRTRRPNARVGPDGSFALVTADRDGARDGEYVITVFWPEDRPPPNPREPLSQFTRALEAAPDRLRGRYAGQKSSTLSARVTGPTDLPTIDLP